MNEINQLEKYIITNLLNKSFEQTPDALAISIFHGNSYTYLEYKQAIEELAIKLLKQGIKKEDKVAIFGDSSPNWGIAYLAIISIGAIAVPLMANFSSLEVDSVIKHSGTINIVVSNSKLVKIDTSVFDNILELETTNIIKGPDPVAMDVIYQFDNPNILESDIASIVYTSGTTGVSKGVELTHKNITFMAKQLGSILDVRPNDRLISILPMAHVYEFTIGFIVPLSKGSHITYLDKPVSVNNLLPALKEVKPTIMLSVPLIIEKIYKKKIAPLYNDGGKLSKIKDANMLRTVVNKIIGFELRKTFGNHLRFFGIGGAKVNPEVEIFLKEANFPYAIGYGLTETSPLVSGGNAQTTKLYSAGKALLGTSLKLSNVNPITGVGEILTKGDHVMKGYYREPELTKTVMTEDGYFKTGDMGYIDKKGYLYITGRLKNMILGPNGENIYPENIAFIVNQHPLVEESLVIEDESRGIIALIKLKTEDVNEIIKNSKDLAIDVTEKITKDIVRFVNSKVNRDSFIRGCEIVQKFEKTASEKIKEYVYKKKSNC